MSKHVEAIYEDGVFRPLASVDLPELQRVQVTVADEDEWLDRDYIQWAASHVQEPVSLDDGRKALTKISGSLTALTAYSRAAPATEAASFPQEQLLRKTGRWNPSKTMPFLKRFRRRFACGAVRRSAARGFPREDRCENRETSRRVSLV